MDPPIRRAAAVAALLPAGEQVVRTALIRRAAAVTALLPAGEQVVRRAAEVAHRQPPNDVTTVWKGIVSGISPFGRVKFCDFPPPGSMDDIGVTDRKTNKLSKSKESLGFSTRKTKNLIQPLDEDDGTEQFIAARKVGELRTQTYCAR